MARLTGPPVAASGPVGGEGVTAHLVGVGSSEVVDDAVQAPINRTPIGASAPHPRAGNQRSRRFWQDVRADIHRLSNGGAMQI
jgi:hypothetical protein